MRVRGTGNTMRMFLGFDCLGSVEQKQTVVHELFHTLRFNVDASRRHAIRYGAYPGNDFQSRAGWHAFERLYTEEPATQWGIATGVLPQGTKPGYRLPWQ